MTWDGSAYYSAESDWLVAWAGGFGSGAWLAENSYFAVSLWNGNYSGQNALDPRSGNTFNVVQMGSDPGASATVTL